MQSFQRCAFSGLIFVALLVAVCAPASFRADALQLEGIPDDLLVGLPTGMIGYYAPQGPLRRTQLQLRNRLHHAAYWRGSNALALASTAPNNVACTSNVVVDYNADPTGAVDSTVAFQMALNATPKPGAAPGNVVCVPPGRYTIGTQTAAPGATTPPHDITIYSPAAANGGAILGPSHGVATIVQNDVKSNILDSCLTVTNAIGSMPEPQICANPVANNVINGWRLSNLTLTYISQVPAPTPGATSGFLNGWAPSAVFFPKVNGLEVHNVQITNAWNCYDFGSQVTSSASFVHIIEGTAFNTCAGHFLALHGGGGNLSVVRQLVQGGRGVNSAPFEGVMYDLTDIAGFPAVGTPAPDLLTSFDFLQNDWEGAAWGTVGWLSDGASFSDYTAEGNICNDLTFACYYFFARPNQSGSSLAGTSHLTFYDQLGTSWYTPLQFDGGSYPDAGGAKVMQVLGGHYIGGDSVETGSTIGGSSIFWIGASPAPNGYSFAADGSAFAVQFQPTPPATFSPWYVTTASPGDTPRTMAMRFAAAYGCGASPTICATPIPISSPPGVNIGTTYMSNPWYAPIEMYEHTPTPGVYVSVPYTVITTGKLFVVNQQAAPPPTCALPPNYPTNGYTQNPAPCWTGYFDQGDGAVFKNDAHDIQISGSKLRSTGQAAVHLVSNGNFIRVFDNVLGAFDSGITYDCLNVEPGANPNIHVESNDCTGAAHSAPLQYGNPVPVAGLYPVIRNNRGFPGVNSTTGFGTIANMGPFDCWYYISWPSGAGAAKVAYPGQTPAPLPSPYPASIFLPVGATLSLSGEVVANAAVLCSP